MSHEITERDGLFTVREAAWHGLGDVLADYPARTEAQQIAHPWEPVAEPIYRKRLVEQSFGPPREVYEELPGYYLNARSDDDEPLGVNPDTFVTIRNGELWDIAEVIEGEDKGSVMYETGGSLKGGKKVWLLLRLREPIVIPGDPHGATIPYYGLQNSHDGSGSFRGQGTVSRIVCDNTSQMADLDSEARGTSFEFHHTRNIRDRIEQARNALAGWRDSIERWQVLSAHLLHDLNLTDEQVTLFIEKFIPEPPPHAASDRVMENVKVARFQLRTIIDGPTCQGIGNTGYGMVQASTEYLNHVRKAQSKESRFKRAYLDRNAITSDAVKLAEQVAHV